MTTNHHEGDSMAIITHDTATRERNASNARSEAASMSGAVNDTDYPPTTHRYVLAYARGEDTNNCGDWAVVCDWQVFGTVADASVFARKMNGSCLPRPLAVFDLDAGTVYDVRESHTYQVFSTPRTIEDYA